MSVACARRNELRDRQVPMRSVANIRIVPPVEDCTGATRFSSTESYIKAVWNNEDKPWIANGPSGIGVRSILEWVRSDFGLDGNRCFSWIKTDKSYIR